MREAFEQAILDHPDDLASYAAFSDWLSEQPDPKQRARGEFIQVQLALENESLSAKQRKVLKKREEKLLAEHRGEWLGPFAPLLANNPVAADPESLERRPNYSVQFKRGFLDTIHVTRLFVDMARALRDAPQTRFLRELVIETLDNYEDEYEPGPDLPQLSERQSAEDIGYYTLLQRDSFPGLRRLRLGADSDMDGHMNDRGPDCHTYLPDIALVTRAPHLEELHLLCKRYDLRALFSCTLSRLSILRVYHQGGYYSRQNPGEYAWPLDVLANNPTFAGLTHLLFHPHQDRAYDPGMSYLPLEQIRHLLRSPHLTKLTHLQLRLSTMGDAGCEELVSSGALKRLRWLDLRHGCITDAGAAILANCADTKNLEYLDLCRNGLTEAGIAQLRAAGINVRADHQQSSEELEDYQYLREGDFE
jgi:uncharacterized protein (TIGR02996 family)